MYEKYRVFNVKVYGTYSYRCILKGVYFMTFPDRHICYYFSSLCIDVFFSYADEQYKVINLDAFRMCMVSHFIKGSPKWPKSRNSTARGIQIMAQCISQTSILLARYFSPRETAPAHATEVALLQSTCTYITWYTRHKKRSSLSI